MLKVSEVRQMRRVTAVGLTVAADERVVVAVGQVVVAVQTVADGLLSVALLFVLRNVKNLIPLTELVVQPVWRLTVAPRTLYARRHICFCILRKH